MDTVSNSIKPMDNIGVISKRMINNQISLSLEDFSKFIVYPFGYTFSSGIYEGSRSVKGFRGGVSTFFLDFDNNTDYNA